MKNTFLPLRNISFFLLSLLLSISAAAQEDIQRSTDPTLGDILVDADGYTLYYFSRDASPDASACTDGCLNVWPVFYVENPSVGTGLDAADFGSFERTDGAMQTTYKGWPLYYFASDANVGDTNGEGVNNIWFVAKPDYGIMLLNDALVGLNGVTYNSMYEPGTETVQFFVDAAGRTLYTFKPDRFNQNNFTAEDFSNNAVWPIYEEDLGSIPSTLDAGLFDVIDVFGRQQLTYKGWPLYYFGQDAERGDTKGVSVPQPGVWPVAVAGVEEALPAINIQLAEDPALGQVLTDGNGNTLYYFTRDATPDASTCTGGCLNVWPVFYAETPVLGTGLEADDFGVFDRGDGVMQTTYKGWPLYYFANDANPGDTNGEGVNNVWFVAKPDYGIMLMNDTLVGLDGVTYNSMYEPGSEMVQYFVDAYGRTLYFFVNDNFDQNNFTAEDFSNNSVWPIYEEDLGRVPSTVDTTLFNTIDVFGRLQLTYKGWPMYYFGQDALRGETKGVSVPSPGIWPVAIPGIDEALVNAVLDIEALSGWKVFPNPFTQSIALQLELKDPASITFGLFNGIGQLVKPFWREDLPGGHHVLQVDNLGQLEKGLYFLRMQSDDGGTTTLRISK
ncbi:MAG: T9SS type A sorting domain-containing protein [Saprospiraceae bacterium]|nr:T9SS type A sorting domain-containing protein [Lewinella sp.]